MLKLVRCTVRVEHLGTVVDRLVGMTCGMTVWETTDSSLEAARKGVYRGYQFRIALQRAVVEIVTDDSWVDDIVRQVPSSDSTIEIFPVEASYHVRNGFMDQ